jgi:hypothetical protein
MKWHPTPLKGVYTGTHNGKSFMLISFEAPTRALRGKKKVDAQLVES